MMKTLLINEFKATEIDPHKQLEAIVNDHSAKTDKAVSDRLNELFQWIHIECRPIGDFK